MCFPNEAEHKSKDFLIDYFSKDQFNNIENKENTGNKVDLSLQPNGYFNTDDLEARKALKDGPTQVDIMPSENEWIKDFSVYSANAYESIYTFQDDPDSQFTL